MNWVSKSFAVSALAVSVFALIAPSAHALSKADQMRANFKLCSKSDKSWQRRWSKHVVAFDLDEAQKVCGAEIWGGTPNAAEPTSCNVDGRWVLAGYHCQQIYGAR